MFVTKRIHPGAFPMNGKFTRLLFLKTAKSKKRKTCRNIFFFRTMHTTFPTYICICWPQLALADADWLRLLLPLRLPAPAGSCLCRLLPAPACSCLSQLLHAPASADSCLPGKQIRTEMCPTHKKCTSPAQNPAETCPPDTTWAQKRTKMCPASTKCRSRAQNPAETRPADTTWAQKRPKMCPAGTKSRSPEQNPAETCPRRKKDEY